MIELPPLPYGASPAYGYTEAEMRAYGEACARAAIEAAAELCDDPPRYNGDDNERATYVFGAQDCGDRIRALTAPSSPSSSQTRS
jgi:hypothetical protein